MIKNPLLVQDGFVICIAVLLLLKGKKKDKFVCIEQNFVREKFHYSHELIYSKMKYASTQKQMQKLGIYRTRVNDAPKIHFACNDYLQLMDKLRKEYGIRDFGEIEKMIDSFSDEFCIWNK